MKNIGILAITNNQTWLNHFSSKLSAYTYLSLDGIVDDIHHLHTPLPHDSPQVLLIDLDFIISSRVDYDYVRSLLVSNKPKYPFVIAIGDAFSHDGINHAPEQDRYGIDYFSKIAPVDESVQIVFDVIRFMKELLEKLNPDTEILPEV